MSNELADILTREGLNLAEYAVLSEVMDTVVVDRAELARFTAMNTNTGWGCTEEACSAAIESCIAKGLLTEFTQERIEAEIQRWEQEPLPWSWGVDLRYGPGDIDVTEAGYRLWHRISDEVYPHARRPAVGYSTRLPGRIDVYKETEAACQEHVARLLEQSRKPGSVRSGGGQRFESCVWAVQRKWARGGMSTFA